MKGLRPDKRTGRRLRRRRLELGLSLRDLASDTAVGYAYLSRVESGERVPSWSALIDVATELETTALQLGLGRAHNCPVCARKRR
jgi:transcriptional regulator with XRE-family HTH domain